MSDLRKAAEMALETLETLDRGDTYKTHNSASALRKALAQPEQEPVAYRVWNRMGGISYRKEKPHESEYVEWDPLYTAPPKRKWVGLTDEEMHECWDSPLTPLGMKHARMIEAKLKEKNT